MIDLLPDADQSAYAEAVSAVLRDNLPLDSLASDALRHPAPEQYWRQWAGLGWFRFAVPEAHGGLGATLVEETLAHRELGRHLATPNALATSAAVWLAHRAGEAEIAEQLMSGEASASFGIAEHPRQVQAEISGPVLAVDAGPSSYLLVMGAENAGLLRISDVQAGREMRGIDDRTRVIECMADKSSVVALTTDPLDLLHVRVLMAAHAAAAAEESCRLAVEYAKLRQQFGKPIGAQQAVAHHCADMAARARGAWAQTRFAAIAVRDHRPDAVYQAESAYLVGIDAALKNAAIGIRVHGGLGFTVGCAIHLYLKRAIFLREAGGGVRQSQRRLLAQASAL